MMSENNVAFRLECYDEVSAITFNRHSSAPSISKRFANFVGDHRHHAPPAADHLDVAPPRNIAADRPSRQRRAELSTDRTTILEGLGVTRCFTGQNPADRQAIQSAKFELMKMPRRIPSRRGKYGRKGEGAMICPADASVTVSLPQRANARRASQPTAGRLRIFNISIGTVKSIWSSPVESFFTYAHFRTDSHLIRDNRILSTPRRSP